MYRIASAFQLTGLTAAIFVSLALPVFAADVKTDSTNPYVKYLIKEAPGSNAGLVLSAKDQQRLEPYDLAIAANPKSASAYVNRAHMYESMQYLGTTHADWQSKAFEDYNSAIKFDPKNVAGYLARAKFFEESKQDQKALNDYSSAIGIAPDAETYDKRGWIYYHNLKQPQKALLDFNASIVLDTCNSNVYGSRALAEKDLGLNDKALKDFTMAIDLAPRSWGDYMYRGQLYQKLGQKAKADEDQRREDVLSRSREPVEFYANAIAEDPSNIGAYYLLADQLMRASQYRPALDALTQVLRLKPKSAEASYLRGQCWEKLKNPQMALNDYAVAIDLDPTGSQAFRWPCIGSASRGIVFSARAEIYVSLGDERKAIDDYSALISLDPENMQAYLSRAKAYGRINDDYAAVRDRSEAIKLVPGNPLLYEMRAYSYDKLHQYDKGVDDCSTAIGIMSTETFQADKPFGDPRQGLGQAYYQRGEFLYRMGKRNAAMADFSQAISLYPAFSKQIEFLTKAMNQ